MKDKYMMDGHKLYWHLDRVSDWQKGKRIAPIHIDVGLSKGCNIKCVYCFGAVQGNFYRQGAPVNFPREPLLRYVREAGESGVRSMALIGEGEPLLNPHVYEAIVEGARAGVDMSLGTNGILLDTGQPGEVALEHLIWIRFNISAATDESYRKIHSSKDFATAVEKIRFCVEQKRRKGLKLTVGLQMVLIPANIDQVVPLAKLGQKLGVDYLVVKQCGDTVDNFLGIYKRLDEYDDFSTILKEAEALSTPDYKVIIKWARITSKGIRHYDQCLGAPFLLYSSGDGRLYPCGMFFDHKEEEYRLGDLTKQSFKEIIASDHYWQIMEKMKAMQVHKECYVHCKTHNLNEFLWQLKDVPDHVNFI